MPPRSIGGKPLVPPTPGPVRPPHTKPVWPPVINPPDPVVPPGTPPVDIAPVVIVPGPPAPPVETVPPHGQPGVWSDGWVLFRQQGGALVLDASTGTRSLTEVKQVFSDERVGRALVNQVLGVLWTGARATTVEPWPVRPNTAQKAAGEALMGTEMSVSEKLDVLIAVAEQTAKDVAEIKAAPVTVEGDTQDHWATAFALTEEPAGLDVPLETFSPEKAALYGVFGRSVINGSATFPRTACVTLARALALGTDIDAAGQAYLDLLVKWEVDRDVAIFALLTGLVDPYEGGLGARLERDVAALAGTVKPETLSDGTVVSRFVRLDFEGAYRKLLPSGSGGQAGQGGA